MVNLRFVGLLQTLSGAERVVTRDHLFDSLMSVAKTALQPNAAPLVKDYAAAAAPMATSNSPTCGHPNSSRQDGQIIGV